MKNDSIWERWLRQAIIRIAILALVIMIVWFVRKQMAEVQHQHPLVTTAIAAVDDEPPPPPKKEIIQQVEQNLNQEIVDIENIDDNPPPPNDMLGLDTADMLAGADAFGLEAKLGGKSLVTMMDTSGDNLQSVNEKYRYYALQIEQHLQSQLSAKNELRFSTYELILKIWINNFGKITRCDVVKSTGNTNTDLKIKKAIELLPALPHAPPVAMPQPVSIKIKTQDYG